MTQGEVRASGSLVDVKLVTKQNELYGKQDRKERWRTWSFKMRAYCAAHVTKLYYIVSVLMDDKALDIGRTCPVRHGVKRWRWRATCWEQRASFRVQRALQAILVVEWNIPGTDATQSLTVWTDQVKDCEQQNSNKTFGGFRSSCNPRTHDECDLMAAEIQAAVGCQVCAREDSPQKTVGITPSRGVRKDNGKAQEPKTITTWGKKSATIATGVVILRRTA